MIRQSSDKPQNGIFRPELDAGPEHG
jgi:hypothetical protein